MAAAFCHFLRLQLPALIHFPGEPLPEEERKTLNTNRYKNKKIKRMMRMMERMAEEEEEEDNDEAQMEVGDEEEGEII